MFSREFLRNLKNTYSAEHLRAIAFENDIETSTNFLQFLFNVSQLFHFDLIKWGVTLHSLLVTRLNLVVAHYSL